MLTFEKIKYPDKFGYVKIKYLDDKLTYKINDYEDLFYLKSIVDSYVNLVGVNDIELTIPCMPQQQHDTRFNNNESFELKLICEFINNLNFKKVKVFHPHSDVTFALLNNCEIIDNSKFIKEVIWKINGNYPKEDTYLNLKKDNLILMSSDAGGFKPLMKLCKKINWQGETYSATKAREKDKLVQIVDRKDFGAKDILLIDDICVYGGTFIGLANLLNERNIGNLYLAVSHLTVEVPKDEIWDFNHVFTTNSKFDNYYNSERNVPKNLTILNYE